MLNWERVHRSLLGYRFRESVSRIPFGQQPLSTTIYTASYVALYRIGETKLSPRWLYSVFPITMYVYRREFFWLYTVTLVATDTTAECIIQSELLYCSLWSSLYNCRKSRPYTEGIVSGVLDDNHLNVIKKSRFSILHSREKSRTSAVISNELKWIRCRHGFAVLSLWICWRRRFVLLVKYLSWNRKYVQTFTIHTTGENIYNLTDLHTAEKP